jgi:hypothetical protein
MEENVKTRFLRFIKEKGIGQTKCEEICGLSRGYFSKIKDNFGTDVLNKIIIAFPDINALWLITGNGNMFSTQEKEEEKNESVSMREVFDQISKLTNTIESQQKTIEYLQDVNEKMSARMAIAENAAGGAQAV